MSAHWGEASVMMPKTAASRSREEHYLILNRLRAARRNRKIKMMLQTVWAICRNTVAAGTADP
jgi:hypothetical protein